VSGIISRRVAGWLGPYRLPLIAHPVNPLHPAIDPANIKTYNAGFFALVREELWDG
jgi:hypothetical protein